MEGAAGGEEGGGGLIYRRPFGGTRSLWRDACAPTDFGLVSLLRAEVAYPVVVETPLNRQVSGPKTSIFYVSMPSIYAENDENLGGSGIFDGVTCP